MNVPRETVYAALFALGSAATLKGLPAFQTASRHVVAPQNAPSRPALFQKQHDETATNELLGLPKWRLRAFWVIYLANSTSPAAVNSTAINDYLDLVDSLLNPRPGVRQTLGGWVEAAAIDGDVMVDENPLGDVATILVPISIFTGE